MTLSSVVFRNMSSEPKPQPSPKPRPRPRKAPVPDKFGPGAGRPDPARYAAGDGAGAADLARALGYDPDDPATWPGHAPAAPAAGSEPTGTTENSGNAAQAGNAAQVGNAAQAGTAAPAEARDDEDAVALTDAKAMRALAHPLRMTLLELFAVRETLTATQASEALGESPANCAFHLRTLAKYGFVREAGGGRGRERPWALANRNMTLATRQPDPQTALAAGELSRLWLERWIERARRAYGTRDELPGWDEASGWFSSHVFLTSEETSRLRGEMRRLLKPYEDRLADPALRPPGALPVEWTVFAAPSPELADPAEGPDRPGNGTRQ
jgi:predicted transcriptional regulator